MRNLVRALGATMVAGALLLAPAVAQATTTSPSGQTSLDSPPQGLRADGRSTPPPVVPRVTVGDASVLTEQGGARLAFDFDLNPDYPILTGFADVMIMVDGTFVGGAEQPDGIIGAGSFNKFYPLSVGTHTIRVEVEHASPITAPVNRVVFEREVTVTAPSADLELVVPPAPSRPTGSNTVTVPVPGAGFHYATSEWVEGEMQFVPLDAGEHELLPESPALCITAVAEPGYVFGVGKDADSWCFEHTDWDPAVDEDGNWVTGPPPGDPEQNLRANITNVVVQPNAQGVALSFDYARMPKWATGQYVVAIDGKFYGDGVTTFTDSGTYDEFIELEPGWHSVTVSGVYAGRDSFGLKEYHFSYFEVKDELSAVEDGRSVSVTDIILGPGDGGFDLEFLHELLPGYSSGAARVYIDGVLHSEERIEVRGTGTYGLFVPAAFGTHRVRIDVIAYADGEETWETAFEWDYRYLDPAITTPVTPQPVTRVNGSNAIVVPAGGHGYSYVDSGGKEVTGTSLTLKPGEKNCVSVVLSPGYVLTEGAIAQWCFTGAKTGTSGGTEGPGNEGSAGNNTGSNTGGTTGPRDAGNDGGKHESQDGKLATTGQQQGLIPGLALAMLSIGAVAIVGARKKGTR